MLGQPNFCWLNKTFFWCIMTNLKNNKYIILAKNWYIKKSRTKENCIEFGIQFFSDFNAYYFNITFSCRYIQKVYISVWIRVFVRKVSVKQHEEGPLKNVIVSNKSGYYSKSSGIGFDFTFLFMAKLERMIPFYSSAIYRIKFISML